MIDYEKAWDSFRLKDIAEMLGLKPNMKTGELEKEQR